MNLSVKYVNHKRGKSKAGNDYFVLESVEPQERRVRTDFIYPVPPISVDEKLNSLDLFDDLELELKANVTRGILSVSGIIE